MKLPLKVTFLGTGTSQGVPVIACGCEVCQSIDSRDKRLRASIMIEIQDKVFIIDTGPDFRQQMLTYNVNKLTAILFTHEHKDHVAGLDDVRAFNFSMKKKIDVYAEQRVQDSIKREFAYVFAEDKYPGVPEIDMHSIKNEPFTVEGISIIPIRAYHYELPVFGFRINDFAYLTDVKTIPADERMKLHNLDILVINALRKKEHLSHMNCDQALDLINELKPKSAYLTHISHNFGLQAYEESRLPHGVYMAYDGIVLNT